MAAGKPLRLKKPRIRLPRVSPRIALMALLLVVSFVGTFIGVSEYITQNVQRLNPVTATFVGGIVAVLTIIMAYAIDRALSPGTKGVARPVYFGIYLGMAIISVGFGFAFWWTAMEARHATNAAMDEDLTRVEASLTDAVAKLDKVGVSLTAVATESRSLSTREDNFGGTCNDGSGPGNGPRTKLRAEQAKYYEDVATDIGQRIDPIKTGMQGTLTAIRAAGVKAATAGQDERVGLLTGAKADLNKLIGDYNRVQKDPTVTTSATTFRRHAGNYSREMGWPDEGVKSFTCRDPSTARRLNDAAANIDALQPLNEAGFRIFEGADAALEAFARLGGMVDNVLSGKGFIAKPGQPGLTGRDWIPFGIAVLIDLGVLALSIDTERRPRRRRPGAGGASDTSAAPDLNAMHGHAARTWLNHDVVGIGTFLVRHRMDEWLVLPNPQKLEERLRPFAGAILDQAASFAASSTPEEPTLELYLSMHGKRADADARKLLAEKGGRTAEYSGGTGYRWYRVLPGGLVRMARSLAVLDGYRSGPNKAPPLELAETTEERYERARTETIEAAMKEEDDKAIAQEAELLRAQRQAERDRLESDAARERFDAEIAAAESQERDSKKRIELAAMKGVVQANQDAADKTSQMAFETREGKLAQRLAQDQEELEKMRRRVESRDARREADRQLWAAKDERGRIDMEVERARMAAANDRRREEVADEVKLDAENRAAELNLARAEAELENARRNAAAEWKREQVRRLAQGLPEQLPTPGFGGVPPEPQAQSMTQQAAAEQAAPRQAEPKVNEDVRAAAFEPIDDMPSFDIPSSPRPAAARESWGGKVLQFFGFGGRRRGPETEGSL